MYKPCLRIVSIALLFGVFGTLLCFGLALLHMWFGAIPLVRGKEMGDAFVVGILTGGMVGMMVGTGVQARLEDEMEAKRVKEVAE